MTDEAKTEVPVPAEHALTRCRSCGAQVFWTRTEAMKSLLVDARPLRRKALVILPLRPGETTHRSRMVEVFEPHFATCPDAARWRGKT